jgi:glycosyltransferase involved in cell wall biosynthesis
MEILVVDGMSTDGTRQIIQRMAAQNNRIKLLDNPKFIQAAAMNIGIKAARGEYIVRTDAHSVYDPSYIRKCIEVTERTGAANVGGYWTALPGADTPVARAIVAATSSRFGVGRALHRIGGTEQETDHAPFGTFRKDLFEKIGLYDERLVRNEDTELSRRIRKAGGRIVISLEIKISYYERATYRKLWQMGFNNGLWNLYTVWLILGKGLSIRHFVPAFFVLGLITFTAGAFFWWPLKWILLGYVLLYSSAACTFAIKRAHQTKTSAILVLWSFVVLHIAYGLGSIWAIITIPFKFSDQHKKITGKPLADRKT